MNDTEDSGQNPSDLKVLSILMGFALHGVGVMAFVGYFLAGRIDALPSILGFVTIAALTYAGWKYLLAQAKRRGGSDAG